eukprot:TRINITY_DN18843_c0_g1_i1.p5 TRINITY_DN18843_c0_g1~~TRINITY_DN18843_c0_g1_i1.p5  ORF type:complete len:114 (-),score=2.86 TRINITY_DN18843_c0_g1_i1:586-900(-)
MENSTPYIQHLVLYSRVTITFFLCPENHYFLLSQVDDFEKMKQKQHPFLQIVFRDNKFMFLLLQFWQNLKFSLNDLNTTPGVVFEKNTSVIIKVGLYSNFFKNF